MHATNLSRVDLNLLVVFDAVAATGSVTAAAARLSLSQPAVSHALGRLRRTVDDVLFIRSRDRLVPTARAAMMIEPVRAILDAINVILNEEAFSPHEDQRTFRMAASDYTVLTLMPGLISALRRVAPRMTLDITPVGPETLRDLESGVLDFTFWGLSPPKSPFEAKFLFHDRFMGFLSRQHPLAAVASGGRLDIEDFLSYPHAVAQFRASDTSPVDAAVAAKGRMRTIALASPSFMSNITSVAGTDLITTLPGRLAPLALSHDLVPFELPVEVAQFPYHLIWHKRLDADPACVWLREIIAELPTTAGQ